MKIWSRKWHISLIILLTLTGCSSMPSRSNITRISLPPQPIVKNSFSLLPLNEEGWSEVDTENDNAFFGPRGFVTKRLGYAGTVRANDILMLGSRGAKPGETRIITGFVKPISVNITDDDFLNFAKSVKK